MSRYEMKQQKDNDKDNDKGKDKVKDKDYTQLKKTEDLVRKVGCERIQRKVTRLRLSCPELEDSSMGALVRLVRSVPRVIFEQQT